MTEQIKKTVSICCLPSDDKETRRKIKDAELNAQIADFVDHLYQAEPTNFAYFVGATQEEILKLANADVAFYRSIDLLRRIAVMHGYVLRIELTIPEGSE